MSAQKDRRSKQRLILAIAVIMVASGLIGAFSTHLAENKPPQPTENAVAAEPSEQLTDSNAVTRGLAPRDGSSQTSGHASSPPQSKSETTPSASEILVSDDACRLLEILKPNSNATIRKMVMTNYLMSTPFHRRFEEYSEVLLGFDATRTSFGAFYLGLAHAHWLESQGWTNPYQRSYGRAARIFLQLARTDIGNAAPAAFALIAIEAALIENDQSLGISEGEKDEAIELLLSATKFDSYTLDYLRELASFDDPTAVSLLLRLQHLSELAIPNWNEFRSRWSRSRSIKSEDKLKIADLIAANAKQAKKPSAHLGYSYLEHRFAQSLAGGARAYETPEKIDASFPFAQKSNFELFAKETSSHGSASTCQEPRVDPTNVRLRAYVKELRNLDAALGVSF